jgi:hypothetical protein
MHYGLLAVLICLLMTQPAIAASIEDVIAEARGACEGLEDGSFHSAEDAVVSIDLNRDGVTDTLIDEAQFSCSSSASLFAPNGGSTLHVIVGDKHYRWQALGWRTITWGEDTILLLARHGTHCGGYGYQKCYESVVFNGNAPTSVATQPE